MYNRLATKLDQLPNGFPATESGVELKILRKIFAPEEAEMALKLKTTSETPEAIAGRLGMPLSETEVMLDKMAKKGRYGPRRKAASKFSPCILLYRNLGVPG